MVELFDRRVALVTGKGGVGRTTVVASLARAAALSGKRVLVTEIAEPDGDYSPLARIYGRETLPAEPVQLERNLHGCVLWPRSGHEAFFHTVIPVGAVVRAAMGSSALRKLLDTAPSFREMGIFYHIYTLLEQEISKGKPRFDIVFVDMPASGHTLGLTGLPERLLALMPTGPIAEAMHRGRPYFTDPKLCGAWIVTLPEILPVTESLELIEGLESHDTPVAGILVNRVLEDPFTPEERAALEPVLTVEHFGHERFVGVVQAKRALELLADKTKLPKIRLPELAADGSALIDGLASALVNR